VWWAAVLYEHKEDFVSEWMTLLSTVFSGASILLGVITLILQLREKDKRK